MPSSPIVLAFDVGGTTVKAAAVDGDLTVLAQVSRRSQHGPAILDVIAEAGQEVLAGLRADQRSAVRAAGVAILGLVDTDRGIALRSVNLQLRDLDVAGPLSSRLGVPVTLGHDVFAAAAAEVRAGSCDAADPFVAVIGTGIAGVAFVGGRPVRGASGQAGEIGHVVVRPDGPLCQCGARGCLEAVASASAIARSYAERAGRDVAGAHEVVDRLDVDPVAAEVWDEAASALADGLLSVCALLAPGAIILGGGLAEAGEALTGPVTTYLKERAHVVPVPPVVTASLGSRAGVVGAALLALDSLAETP